MTTNTDDANTEALSLSGPDARRDLAVLQQVLNLLSTVPHATQSRILKSVRVFLGHDESIGLAISPSDRSTRLVPSGQSSVVQRRQQHFTEHEDLSPKQFLSQKSPKTDIEKAVCLAYYLTHYREKRFFKTADVTSLCTEAALVPFSNTTQAVKNAASRGLLAPGAKSTKQITVVGEEYVDVLPDRERLREVTKKLRGRGNSRKRPSRKQ